jgi:MFS family permease
VIAPLTSVHRPGTDSPDPRRWITLAIVVLSIVLTAMDVAVLNVAIPTMLRELHATVPQLQWVITGYSLTFAAFLIIGGRLGDMYGHRRMFVIGGFLFGLGSLIASEARSVGQLIVGEAVIEGLGAALMMPASLAILSTTFRGRERATAFAAWTAAAGGSAAFGPLVGGYLTTEHSWRWAFRINVLLAPFAIVGALLLIPRGQRTRRTNIDLLGAALAAGSMFLVTFGLSQSGVYDWWSPLAPLSVGGITVWPDDLAISASPVALARLPTHETAGGGSRSSPRRRWAPAPCSSRRSWRHRDAERPRGSRGSWAW